MMHTLLHRLRRSGERDSEAPPVRGTTIVREERGSGAGAVLFQPYRVAEFVPHADPEPGGSEPVAETRASNPVAEEWRRSSPEVFRGVARRFCARAPKATEELRASCLQGDCETLVRLARTLQPALSLFDLSAGDAAARVQAAASDGASDALAYAVLALEHEIWRVAAAWQASDGHGDGTAKGDAP
ncbi:MAG: hypothetical protein OEW19_09705 [Acidobacteriota bacterium]|nr:hypothetical protein [Acidobacteriota bacterium]